MKPTHTPEAFVLNSAGNIVYRGWIDIVYAELGKRRLEPTSREVRDAVAALIHGTEPASSYEEPVGCHFERRTEEGKNY